MNDVEILAITKAIETRLAKTAREAVEPGEYHLSFDAHIEGVLRVGADYEQRIPNKAKPWHLVSVLLLEMAVLRAAAGVAGIDLARLIDLAEKIDDNLAEDTRRKAEAEAAKIKSETVTPCKGKVTADLKVVEVRR